MQIEIACMANITDNFAEGEAKNVPAMVTNVEEHGVQIGKWTPEQLAAFVGAWLEVVDELKAEDEMFAKAWDDLSEFHEGDATWFNNIYLPRPRN